jgi:phosphatidylglycerophosphatase C
VSGLALFDFDGTLTRKDTFITFTKFCVGTTKFYIGMAVLTPVLILYKLKLIKNWRAKEIVFGYFFKGMPSSEFESLGRKYALIEVPKLIRPSALSILKIHQQKGDRILLVTASAEAWIKAWADQFQIEILATAWEVKNGVITGKIEGKNCFGPEKRVRIMNHVSLEEFIEISAYGDSNGDTEMLEMANNPNYRVFVD